MESLQKMKIDQANNAIVIYIVRWEPTQCRKPYIQRATPDEPKEFYKMQEIFEYKYHENLEELQM